MLLVSLDLATIYTCAIGTNVLRVYDLMVFVQTRFANRTTLLRLLSKVRKRPFLPLFHKPSLNRIVEYISDHSLPFLIIPNRMIIAFVLPEMSLPLQKFVSFMAGKTLDRVQDLRQRIIFGIALLVVRLRFG